MVQSTALHVDEVEDELDVLMQELELTDSNIDMIVQKVDLTERISCVEKTGKTFDFRSITKEEMLDLYINFRFDDCGISAIFDVDIMDVWEKRYELDINKKDGVISQLERYLVQEGSKCQRVSM